MRDGPSGPAGRGGFQTAECCCGPMAVVVSDSGKGRARLCQVSAGKANESEPLMKCRKRRNVVETGVLLLSQDEARGKPVFCLRGNRHEGGASPVQAFVWNVGTYRSDVKGELTSGSPTRRRVPMQSGGADRCVVVMKPCNGGGAKAPTCPAEGMSQLARGGAYARSKVV